MPEIVNGKFSAGRNFEDERRMRESRQVKAAVTEKPTFYHDASGNTILIIGLLQFDDHGNATGLGAVYGIASHKTGAWVQL